MRAKNEGETNERCSLVILARDISRSNNRRAVGHSEVQQAGLQSPRGSCISSSPQCCVIGTIKAYLGDTGIPRKLVQMRDRF